MAKMHDFWLRVRGLLRRDQLDRDLREEMEFHLAMRTQSFVESGVPDQDAENAARRRFGNATRLQEETRGQWTFTGLESFWHDVRFGARQLRRNPGFAVLAILVLALGIGANTAIFSLMNAVLLRDLPVEQPNRLVLFGDQTGAGSVNYFPRTSMQLFSFPFYREIQQQNQVFSGVAAISSLATDVHGRIGDAAGLEPLHAQLASGTYFQVLGIHPVLGYLWTAAVDRNTGAHPVAVISYAWWQRRFAGSPAVVGKKITIRSTVYTITGVAPRGFFGVNVGTSPELWVPLSMEKQMSPGWHGLHDKLFQSLYILARLNPGMSRRQAGAAINVEFKQILQQWAGPHPSALLRNNIAHASIHLTSAATGLSELRWTYTNPLKILMSVVGLVLLICCANLANLLLARATARKREMTLRQALGAPRRRLVRQLVTESLLLAVTGGALGVALAWGGSRLLLAMVSTGPHELPLQVAPDGHVLAFTLLLTVLTVFLSGLAPAILGTRVDLNASLKDGSAGSGHGRNPFARSLIVAQVALSLVLLVGSGLFLRSLVNLTHVETGFNPHHLLEFRLDEASAGYTGNAQLTAVDEQIEQRVQHQPGVEAASIAFTTFNEGGWFMPVYVAGKPNLHKNQIVVHNRVGAEYFRAMGIPLLRGRVFGAQDTAAAPKVAVVNETFAKTYFPGTPALGRRIGQYGTKPADLMTIVGVVADAKYEFVRDKPMPAAYYPYAQDIGLYGDLVVRYRGSAAPIAQEVRRAVAGVDRNIPVSAPVSMERKVGNSLSESALVAQLSAFFGLLAVLLASIGLYGLMSYTVARRTGEIGVRMALGAGRGNVAWLVMKDVLLLASIGLVIGIPAALAGGRVVASTLYGIRPTDLFSFGVGVVFLLLVAALAGYLPARRAARVNPVIALRYE